jgi:hypothetical protein
MPRVRPEERKRAITSPISDPAVEAVRIPEEISEAGLESQLARQRARTPGQRRKAKRDQTRNRLLIDLPEELIVLIDRLVEEEGVSKSRFVGFMTILGLYKMLDEGIDLNEYKTPPRSPRFEYALQLPDVPDISQFSHLFQNSQDQNKH